MWIAAYYIGRVLFEEKNKYNIFKAISIIAVSAMLLTCINMLSSEIIEGTLKILCVYTLQCLFYKVAFNKSIEKKEERHKKIINEMRRRNSYIQNVEKSEEVKGNYNYMCLSYYYFIRYNVNFKCTF